MITNFKKKPQSSNAHELRYKQLAIREAANVFRSVLTSDVNRDKLQRATLVPTPPSAIPGDAAHDDRMLRLLKLLGRGLGLDIRELVKQRYSVTPAHETDIRPTIEALCDVCYIDETVTDPEPNSIWIFDDVLTAGCHYKAMQRVLQERFPSIATAGFFVARRVPELDLDLNFDSG